MHINGDVKTKWNEIAGFTMALILVVILLSAIPVGLKYFRDFDPQAAKVDEFIRKSRAGEWEQAYLCTDQEFRKAVDIDKMRIVMEMQPGFQTGGSHKLDSFNYTSTRAGTVNARLTSPDGNVVIMCFVLYLPVTGSNFLIDDIEINQQSLFAIK